MRPADVPAAERLSAEAFLGVDRALRAPGDPEPQERPQPRAARWVARTLGTVATDPGGCWVAEDPGAPGAPDGLVGFATSMRRDGTWVLATYAVRPGRQGRGVGRHLLDAALTHSRGCLRGMLSSSADPAAVRRYVLAGFEMHPQMTLAGTVDRSAIPPGTGERVREGTSADTDLLESLDRRRRGSGHGPDHAYLQDTCRLLVVETRAASGYAYLDRESSVQLLAATDRRTAARLLWTALADGPEQQRVTHVTAANAWAVEIGTAARLALRTSGFLALRGMDPPAPYLHHGALL